ncbi:MAG TPA: hypothetical protein VII39_05400 [Bradyrhizobium sp.]
MARHSDHLDPLVIVAEAGVDVLQTILVFESSNGIDKIHTELATIDDGIAIVIRISPTK